jgi:aspartyl protease family protein
MSTSRTGVSMYILAIIAFIVVVALLFAEQIEKQRNPNRNVALKKAPDGAIEVVLRRNPQGHYIANGFINGHQAELVLDTGATDVAVSSALAKKASLTPHREINVNTANGRAVAYATTIDEIRIGGILEQNISATIVPHMAGIDVLLGMSFLKNLDFAQEGNVLRLTSRRQMMQGHQEN